MECERRPDSCPWCGAHGEGQGADTFWEVWSGRYRELSPWQFSDHQYYCHAWVARRFISSANRRYSKVRWNIMAVANIARNGTWRFFSYSSTVPQTGCWGFWNLCTGSAFIDYFLPVVLLAQDNTPVWHSSSINLMNISRNPFDRISWVLPISRSYFPRITYFKSIIPLQTAL